VCAYHFSGFDYFRFPELYQQITVQDILDFLQQTVHPQQASLACIYPTEQEETL
jgi:predicted Zn-dependent peptidase